MNKATAGRLDALTLPELDPARPTAGQIRDAIKSAILTTELPPGCLVSEMEIGARFGASRTPVREAFAMLRDDGLIVTRPSRGNYVSKLSEDAIRQAQFLREGLELATVARLCEAGLPQDIRDGLAHCLTVQAEAVAAQDNTRFQRQDDRFHALLARATGMERVETVLRREKSVLDRLRVLSLNPPGHKQRLLDEHHAILSAILDQNAPRATDAMRLHLRSILGTLQQVITENREYFQ